ncbi:hypothetical protein Thiowin_01438 [Thiorhodovibrio winogradskyi]|uniref:Uncharacterized protein n=1 Tax=Thiorhodovibrio winogradskyi TaxID=77007 RepID=A0ABZ0S8R3_9GAMM
MSLMSHHTEDAGLVSLDIAGIAHQQAATFDPADLTGRLKDQSGQAVDALSWAG